MRRSVLNDMHVKIMPNGNVLHEGNDETLVRSGPSAVEVCGEANQLSSLKRPIIA